MKMPEARPALVPELRFPEFRDAVPWEAKRLGELVETVTPPMKLQTSEYLPSGRFPIIDQSPSDVCGWTDDETAMVQADFPLVVFGDHSCVVKLANGPFAQGADGIKILAPTSEIEARFLFLSLQADPIEQKGYKRHFSTLKEKQIPFPRKDTGEQQKIADCLGSLDDLIRAEERRVEALSAHKTGLMQRLFPAQGETTPRLRFPEFRNAGPWEVKRLEQYVEQKAGNSKLIKGKLYAEPGEGRFSGFSASGQDVWLDGYEHEGPAIIVSAVGARCGRCFFADGKWSAIANTHILFPQQDDMDIRFLFEMVTRDGFWVISGSGQPFVKVRDSLRQEVPLPSVPEQQKIANCLSSLDDLIRAQGETIEALKAHKRGLMQQLFPREVG
jgi:type I restriction enzyme S subunit